MVNVFRTVAAVVMISVVGIPASADPIPILSGSLVAGPFSPYNAVFDVQVPGATVQGRWPNGLLQAGVDCTGCAPGTSVSPDARFVYDTVPFVFGDPFATATVIRDGEPGKTFFLQGTLAFSGASFELPVPADVDDLAPVVFMRPFSFRGNVTGYDRLLQGPFSPDPAFTASLFGGGTAHLEFLLSPAGQYFHFRTSYEFEPVPEPTSVLMIGAGAITLLVGRRRRGSK